MSMSINTNVASLNAQRNLSSSQSALSTSLQRLSSGTRINSAKDDAAGLAISERMSSQINGLDQARRNANDGISLAQTAEGGMVAASDMLQRMRGLAVQSANDTNSASDRKAIQAEVNQLKEELNRLVDTTQFNGQNLLDGSMTNKQFQVGANANQTINVSVGNIRGTAIGNYGATAGGTAGGVVSSANNNISAGTLSIAGNGKAKAVTISANNSAQAIAKKINAFTSDTGVTASAKTTVTIDANKTNTSAGTMIFKLQGDNANAIQISAQIGSGSDRNSNLAKAINDQTASTGVSAKINSDGTLELSNSNGADIKLTGAAGSAVDMNVGALKLTAGAGSAKTISGKINYDSNDAFSVTVGGGMAASLLSQTSKLSAVDVIDMSTAAGANNALKVLDAALSTVNSRRADLGAVQNRFSNTISNLQSSAENLNASRGRILDTDFAAETAKMSRNQVLQQAGTAMLAQANQLPQQVLQLLR